MCSETSEAVGTIWEHAQKEFQKFLKIRITLLPHPGHPVHASHPGNPVPVIRSVLQGRVYQRFGIFCVRDGME